MKKAGELIRPPSRMVRLPTPTLPTMNANDGLTSPAFRVPPLRTVSVPLPALPTRNWSDRLTVGPGERKGPAGDVRGAGGELQRVDRPAGRERQGAGGGVDQVVRAARDRSAEREPAAARSGDRGRGGQRRGGGQDHVAGTGDRD